MSADEYALLLESFKSTRGNEIFQQIHSIVVSHEIFLGNHNELIKKLAFHSNFSNTADIYNPGNSDKMQTEFHEIKRLIHNYVAAVKSLVDHTRRITNKLIKGNNFTAYQQRVDTDFSNDPLTSFLHDLRNYLLHVSHPPINFTMSFSDNNLSSIGIQFSRSELLSWEGWRERSVRFMENYPNGIPISKIVLDYEQKVYHFLEWLLAHITRACQSELDEFRVKRQRWIDFCKQHRIPVTNTDWCEYMETEMQG